MKQIKLLAVLMALVLLCTSATNQKTTTIFIIGDSTAAKMNLNIKAEGDNEHHKIEGIFKALARALKMAVRRDVYHYELPSTKGTL